MLTYKKISLEDKDWIQPLINIADSRGCHINFTNLFIWSGIYNYQITKTDGFLIVKGNISKTKPYYFFPIGSGNIKNAIDNLIQDAHDCNHELSFFGLSKENVEIMKKLYPNKFIYKEERDSFDYIYTLDKLINLSGKKLSAKRNHINHFKANNNWSFEVITPGNLSECWEMNKKWCLNNDCQSDVQLAKEKCAVRLCFDNYKPLGLLGGLIRIDGEVVAYTMGDCLNSDTFDVHIEKAFSDIQGAYQIINNKFAALIKEKYPHIIYANREEDMGLDGLRRAKLSYYPDMMEEKSSAVYLSV